jgi:predicted nucleotidyltransferase
MLKNKEIKNIVNKIKEEINPDQIFLFGSYATGKMSENSDLDLLVIDNSRKKSQITALKISKLLFPRKYGLDLIVMNSKEIEKKKNDNFSFWQEILISGKKLYERKRT